MKDVLVMLKSGVELRLLLTPAQVGEVKDSIGPGRVYIIGEKQGVADSIPWDRVTPGLRVSRILKTAKKQRSHRVTPVEHVPDFNLGGAYDPRGSSLRRVHSSLLSEN